MNESREAARTLLDAISRILLGSDPPSDVELACLRLLTIRNVSEAGVSRLLRQVSDSPYLVSALAMFESWGGEQPATEAELAVLRLLLNRSVTEGALSALLRRISDNPKLVALLGKFHGSGDALPLTPVEEQCLDMVLRSRVDRRAILGLLRSASNDSLQNEILAAFQDNGIDRPPSDAELACLRLLTTRNVSEAGVSRLLRQVSDSPYLVSALAMFESWGDKQPATEAELVVLRLLLNRSITEGALSALLRRISDNPKLVALLGKFQGSGDALPLTPVEEQCLDMVLRSRVDRRAILGLLRSVSNDSLQNEILAAFQDNGIDKERLKTLWHLFSRARYVEDGCATVADAGWLEDTDFVAAYDAGARHSRWGHDLRWRIYTLLKAAKNALQLPGDFVECGVAGGGTAISVMRYLGDSAFRDRLFYLFDLFGQVPYQELPDEERSLLDDYDERGPPNFDHALSAFGAIDYARPVPGRVPASLEAFSGGAVAYLHIDMNVAAAECSALEYFWPRMSAGAPVIFDDYGFPNHSRQRIALDKTAAGLNSEIMMLPTGQGLMWKR